MPQLSEVAGVPKETPKAKHPELVVVLMSAGAVITGSSSSSTVT